MYDIERWLEILSKKEMPVLRHTAQTAASIAAGTERPVSALTNLVLKDVGLTAAILRTCNSAFYNPRGIQITTVSRAVQVLGFDEIRSMCLSLVMIDAFIKGKPRARVLHETTRAFHAAFQAKKVAVRRRDSSVEEVFIAALLYRIGHMVFWCYAGDAGDELLEVFEKGTLTEIQAEKQVLGFTLDRLTREIVNEWQISNLLEVAFKDPTGNDPRTKNVLLCHKIAQKAENGWEDPQLEQPIKDLAEFLESDIEETRVLVYEAAREAVRLANSCGAKTIAKQIPLPLEQKEEEGAEEAASEDPCGHRSYRFGAVQIFEPDPMLQLQILREISSMVTSSTDSNTVIQMVLEGIYRGVGMDRVFFALKSQEKRQLEVKYAVGPDKDEVIQALSIRLNSEDPTVFDNVVERQESLWVRRDELQGNKFNIPLALFTLVDQESFFLGAVIVKNSCAGVIYGDRALSKRSLNVDDFDSFQHFVEQTNLALDHLARHEDHE